MSTKEEHAHAEHLHALFFLPVCHAMHSKRALLPARVGSVMEHSGQFDSVTTWTRHALLPEAKYGQAKESKCSVGFNSCGIMTFYAAHAFLHGQVWFVTCLHVMQCTGPAASHSVIYCYHLMQCACAASHASRYGCSCRKDSGHVHARDCTQRSIHRKRCWYVGILGIR